MVKNKKTSEIKKNKKVSINKRKNNQLDSVKKLLSQINKYKKTINENIDKEIKLNEKNIRLLAEFENYKKRTIQEKNKLAEISICNFIKNLIPSLDDLERTIDSVTIKKKNEPFYNGILMIVENLHRILLDYGVKSFNSIGKKFDPEFHDAIANQESNKHDDGIVLIEYQKGYKYNENVLRHAKVVVSKNKVKA